MDDGLGLCFSDVPGGVGRAIDGPQFVGGWPNRPAADAHEAVRQQPTVAARWSTSGVHSLRLASYLASHLTATQQG